jgi:hypothetical protein
MKFLLDDLPVIFPYEYIYPEQYQYMSDIKKGLDAKYYLITSEVTVCWKCPQGPAKLYSKSNLDCPIIAHCRIPAVLSRKEETHLLFTNGS